jgi:hypothetical protein
VRRSAAPLAIAALLAAAPAAAAAPERHPNCVPKRSHGYGASNRLRVFGVPGPGAGGAGYACDLRTGLRRKLWRATDRRVDARMVRFAGTAAAYHERSGPGQDAFIRSVEVTGGRKLGASIGADAAVSDLVVAPSGSAAYVARRDSGLSVATLTARGGERLDAGPLVEPGSLALAEDSRLYWTSGALPRSAGLDPEPQRLPAPSSVGGSDRCYPRGSATEAAGARVRVYSREYTPEGERTVQYVACDLRSGRRTLLAAFDDPDTSFSFDQIRVAGPLVAYAGYGCFKAECGSGVVHVIDTRTGRTAVTAPMGPSRTVRVTGLVVAADGSVAWIRAARGVDGASPATAVHRCDASGCARLDEGDGIDPASLALSEGARLYWAKDGAPRSATLD